MSEADRLEIDDWVLDFESLLAPVSEEHPCGTDQYVGLVEAQRGLFDMLGPAWCQEGFGETRGETEKKVLDFLRDSQELFTSKCKSLELPVVCTALMVQTYGLRGLRDALEWINRSLVKFGSQLYPKHPDGIADTANRLGRVFRSQFFAKSGVGSWSSLAIQLRLLPITADRDSKKVYADLMTVWSMAAEGEPEYPDDLRQVAASASPEYYKELLAAAAHSIRLCQEINTQFRAAYEFEGVGVLRLISHEVLSFLEDFQRHILDFAEKFCPGFEVGTAGDDRQEQHDGAFFVEPAGVASSITTAAGRAAGHPAGFDGEIRNRADAVRMLKQVAEYFLENELHSPVGYRLHEALEWTKLSLPELLVKLLGSDQEHYRRVASRIGFDADFEE